MHTHTQTQTHRQTHRQTDTHRHTQTHTDTHRHTQTHIQYFLNLSVEVSRANSDAIFDA
jgi:hypothetical protein